MAPPESESLNEVRQKINAVKATLAQVDGKDELLLMYGNLLVELQKKNRLMQAAG